MFDPYHKWLGIPREEQPPNHYRLLGLALFELDPEVIDAAANRQMAYLQSCANGPHALLSQRLLNDVAAARLCLLDPAKRMAYDAGLKRKQTTPGSTSARSPSDATPDVSAARSVMEAMRRSLEDETEAQNLLQIARLHLAQGQLHDAVAQATEAIRLEGKEPAAYLVRAEAHRRLKRPERALADLAVAIRLDPNQPSPYVIRAEILKRRNMFDQALADATHALTLDPRNAAAYAIRAECRSAIGDRAGANEDVQEMLLIDPTRSVPNLPAASASAEPSPVIASDDDRFWKEAGPTDPKVHGDIFADGKPADRSLKTRKPVGATGAAEALVDASDYRPEVMPGPLPRFRARRKRSQVVPIIAGLVCLGLLGVGYVLINQTGNSPDAGPSKGPSPPPTASTVAKAEPEHTSNVSPGPGVAVKPPSSPASFTNSIGMMLKRIPAGEFLMGSPDGHKEADEDEKPRHRVRISKSFYFGVYEVTQVQYEAVMGNNPSYFSTNGEGKDKVAGKSTGQHPVETVSWFDAVLFCNKLSDMEGRKPFYTRDENNVHVPDWNGPGYRLPAEAEWEYACRANASTPTRYSFGDDTAELGEYGWFEGNSEKRTHPVGRKKPNGFGLHDMHGNVFEWCWDWYGRRYYEQLREDDPTGPGPDGAPNRVHRGGGLSFWPRECGSAFRSGYAPEGRSFSLGFRLAVGQFAARDKAPDGSGDTKAATSNVENRQEPTIPTEKDRTQAAPVTLEPIKLVASVAPPPQPHAGQQPNDSTGNTTIHPAATESDFRHFPPAVPNDAIKFRDHSYRIFFDQLTWHAAKAKCEEMGGHLLIIKSKEENTFIRKLALRSGRTWGDWEGLWIGLTDEKREGRWVWIDGADLKRPNWMPNQPDNSQNQEHYAVICIKDGKWNDTPRSHRAGFVCEWGQTSTRN